jgi:predicted nucleic acid-binding protein
MIFVDASALVKRYVRERHSVKVRQLLANDAVAVSRLSDVEVPSAFARLAREGRLATRARDRALRAFATDLTSWYVVELTTELTTLAREQLLRYDLRTGDAIQLASAIWLRQATPLAGLLAFDNRLVRAAVAEQFVVPMARRVAS